MHLYITIYVAYVHAYMPVNLFVSLCIHAYPWECEYE